MPEDDDLPDAKGASSPEDRPDETPGAGADDGPDEESTPYGPAHDADPAQEDSARDARSKERRKTPIWVETGVLLGVALVMALIIKTFFVQAFYIPSQSMEPGLKVNDRILVQKVSYWFGGSPSRGDIIVFADPGGWLEGPEPGPQTWLAKGLAKVGLYPTGGHLVKRVIGVGGDTVICCDKEGRVSVNGHPLDEKSFVAKGLPCDGPQINNCSRDWSVTVPKDTLFVMGDNRNQSEDSAAHYQECMSTKKGCDGCLEPACATPFVDLDLVVGKVFALVWPMGHARIIKRPSTFDGVPDPK